MWKIILYSLTQSLVLCGGQVFLKIGLSRMLPFGWNRAFWKSVFLNWQFAVCGVLFASAGLLWMYIVKHWPLSVVYPLVSMSYVFGLIAAFFVFHEQVALAKWIGVAFIVLGCFFVLR